VGAEPDVQVVFDPDTYVRGVPYETLARLRAREPVTWVEETPDGPWQAGPGYWAVWRHADVRHVLRQPDLFSSQLGATQIRDPATREDLAYVQRSMVNMDAPGHGRLRGLLARSFTPRAVAALEHLIEARATALVDSVAEAGSCDFARLAADLPLLTLADLLGMPESDRSLLFDWASRAIGYQDQEYAAVDVTDRAGSTTMARAALAVRPRPDAAGRMPDPRSRDGMPDLYAYAHELAAHKRRHPGGDVMSLLLQQVDDAGGRVSVEEFENMFWLLAVAGNETVRNAVPGGMIALLEHPDQLARLRADRSLLDTAVDEVLRWWTPVVHFRRTAARDGEIAGRPVRAGQKVVVYFSSANRDERVFPEPDRFDVGRRPNDHLAFGHGVHFCLGAYVARRQMRAIFAAALDRFPDVEQAGPAVRLRSNFQNGVKHLPIRWRVGAR
jgi:cytochrome P450